MNAKELGKLGEDLAADFLLERGWRILTRNLRLAGAELDIVAKEGETVVFVEVKTRRSLDCGSPCASVTWRKQRQIIKAARIYLAHENLLDCPCRFDVVQVYFITAQNYNIDLMSGVFEC